MCTVLWYVRNGLRITMIWRTDAKEKSYVQYSKNWFKFLAPCRMNDWTSFVYQSIKNRKESKMPMMQRNWRTRRVTRQPKLSIWLAHFEFDNDVFEFFQFTKVKTYIITSFYHDIVLFTRTMQTLRSRSHQCSNTIDFSDDSWYVYAGKAKGKWSHLSNLCRQFCEVEITTIWILNWGSSQSTRTEHPSSTRTINNSILL